jgi:glycosyltransferase involved in cell wall biosynthesis
MGTFYKHNKMRVLFLAPYPKSIAPSQRFRMEHYLPYLNTKNIAYDYKTFVNAKDFETIFTAGQILKKTFIMTKGLVKRILLFFTLHKFNFIYIQREAAPFGPPVFEWAIAKIWRKKIIYDFDDSIWISKSSAINPMAHKIKCTWKVANICKWSYIVTVGNNFLAEYAKQYCKDVRVIPTVIDTDNTHNKIKNQNDLPITIGWTGTFTNFKQLPIVLEAITQLQKKYTFIFLIIADKDPALTNINYKYIKWNKETEIIDLLRISIGIMPLKNTELELGKCAFKAIQYMGLGIPAVVSPVGANCEVVQDNINGLWANNDWEWSVALEKLIQSNELRNKLGIAARETIVNKYSVNNTKEVFLDLFGAS